MRAMCTRWAGWTSLLALALVACKSGDGPSCEELSARMGYQQGRTPGSALRECKVAGWTADMRACVAASEIDEPSTED